MDKKKFVEYIIIKGRWLFVCSVLLPLLIVLKIITYLQYLIHLNRFSTTHSLRVNEIRKQIEIRNKKQETTPMCTARPDWKCMTPSEIIYKNYFYNIRIDLTEILKLNTAEKTVIVESSVTFGHLITYLISAGWTLPVVVDLEDLTIGGIVMGMGIESSCHIHGLFHHTCVSYELILGDGSLVTCSKLENEDLFNSIPGSYGTLGFLTAVEIRILPAKKYVEISYEPVYTLDELATTFEDKCVNSENEFVEAIVFGLTEAVVVCGKTVDMLPLDQKAINQIGRWYKPWYYKYVQEFLNREKYTEYVPLLDYYLRHNRSLFWELEAIIPFGNSSIFRGLFGWLMPPKISWLKRTQTPIIKQLYKEHHVVQDVWVPVNELVQFLLLVDRNIQVYPIWLCPFKSFDESGMLQKKNLKSESQLYVDIGVYGEPKVSSYDYEKTVITIENEALLRNGYIMCYAGTYLSEEKFRKMYDHELYDKVRNDYQCCKAFPSLYDKVNKSSRF